MNCPICNSDRFYYVQRSIEYFTVDHIMGDGIVELDECVDSVIDNDFSCYFWCEDCDQKPDFYTDDMENIVWSTSKKDGAPPLL